MNMKRHKSGMTLSELLVVIAIISAMVGVGVPAVKQMFKTVETSAGAGNMISAALASSRAFAAREDTYAGVRFQQDVEGRQYMIFIVHDSVATGLANGYCAVEGLKPISLPRNVGVMGLKDTITAGFGTVEWLNDAATFSMIFSKSGSIVIRGVRVRNIDGFVASSGDLSGDKVFNAIEQLSAGIGQFCQDDYPDLGFSEESSRNNFLIYDKKLFDSMSLVQRDEYIKGLEANYVNRYTGRIVAD